MRSSNVRARFGVTLQIPAGHESRVWEQCVNAGLRLRRIKHENSLPVFLLHRVVAGNCYLAKNCISGEAITKNSIVGGVGDQRDSNRYQETHNNQSPQKTADSCFQRGTHGVQL
jgi:hypothetical protein